MSFGMAYATKKRGKKCMAKGGEVKDPRGQELGDQAEAEGYPIRAKQYRTGNYVPYSNEAEGREEDADMIARIMHKRKEYSQGGMVANDVGVAEADELPAEFDDLVLDDHLEDASGAGNEHGDEDVHDDSIDRIMLKRKKDRMPRPA